MTDRLLTDPACLEGKTQEENQENCDELLNMRLQEGTSMSATEAANSCCSSVVKSRRRNNMTKSVVFALVLLTLGQVSCQENLFQCPRGEFFFKKNCNSCLTKITRITVLYQ